HLGESAEAALARELTEELGHEFPPGTLALVVENIYRGEGMEHEIGFYYRLAWPATLSRDDLGGGEPGHVFRWAPATGLGSLRFEPAGLASVLHNLDGTLRHLVLDQEDGWAGQAGERAAMRQGMPQRGVRRPRGPACRLARR